MTYLALIRYKDGQEKLLHLAGKMSLAFPIVNTINSYDNLNGLYTTKFELTPVPPMQSVWDINGNEHWINVTEILDISIEENE